MRAVDGLRDGDRIDKTSIALTGDGSKERKILKAIAGRYPQPNIKLLWIPENVAVFEHGSRRTGRYCGFSALRPIRTFIEKYKICSYLVIVDYEHVDRDVNIDTQIENRVQENGFNPISFQQLANQAFLIKCSDATHVVALYVVVSGANRRVEENEASLINLCYGVNIGPEKNIISSFYSQHHTNLTELIKNANRTHLNSAFRDLVAALDEIENTN